MHDFETGAQKIFDWTCQYLKDNDAYDVLPKVEPGEIYQRLEPCPPEKGQPLEHIFEEFKRDILPGITHWNHPGFFAYFNSSAGVPSVMADMLSSAVNTNVMLWKASPAGTEVEQKVLEWLAGLLGLEGFTGISFSGGATSSFHALAAMREDKLGPVFRKSGFFGVANMRPRLYVTEQTHNSIHKAIVALGFGMDNIVEIPVDDRFRMNPSALADRVKQDKQAGFTPLAVIATLGTTSCTAIDPVDEISAVCRAEDLWLHVDAAHGGSAAVVASVREAYKGWEQADSILTNPHKWMNIAIELSVLYMKNPGILKNAFQYSAEYLKTAQDGRIESYMDYGIPLGRRFRCLKLWFSLKYYGADFFRQAIDTHLALSQKVYDRLDANPDFEIMAPKPLSTVCFRALPANGADPDRFNEQLMDRVNDTGSYFISHTRLNNCFVLRHVTSGYRTREHHVDGFLETIAALKKELDAGPA